MFEAFGRHVYDVGEFGNGCKMKYVPADAIERLIAAESAPVELRGWVRHGELMSLLAGARLLPRLFRQRK